MHELNAMDNPFRLYSSFLADAVSCGGSFNETTVACRVLFSTVLCPESGIASAPSLEYAEVY